MQGRARLTFWLAVWALLKTMMSLFKMGNMSEEGKSEFHFRCAEFEQPVRHKEVLGTETDEVVWS